jgi:glucosamine 6-phosphate synthetase-like amidotransferase/phosphosugar isomerase protein
MVDMCGIAGFSLGKTSTVDRTRAAQALLAGIAERGADAVGYAHRSPGGSIVVHKQRSGASALLEQIALPRDACHALVHVRDYTKGHPRIEANNHPVRHGNVFGIHNGHIDNDDALMAQYGFERAQPEMTVDSEVIFALAEANGGTARGFDEFRGSLASAWLDEREPELLYLARGVGRPLWVGTTRRELFFASTREALEIAERYTGLRLRKREVGEGRVAAIKGARAIRVDHFVPDPTYEPDSLPSARAPREGELTLQALAALAGA